MEKKMTPKQFIYKCASEGGGLEHGFEYGLTSKDLDSSDPKFKLLVKAAEDEYNNFIQARDELYEEYAHPEDPYWNEEDNE